MREFNKNKKLITCIDWIFIIFISVVILSQMEIQFEINFHYLRNGNTNTTMSMGGSIFAYVFYGLFIGMMLSSLIYLVSCYVIFFLHRKDKDDPPPRFIPIPRKYDDETMFAYYFSFGVGYIITYLGVILYALGIVSF